MSPRALVLPQLDVSGDVRLRPSFVGLQGDQTLFAKWGDLSPAAGRLEGLGGGAEVDERCSDQMLRGESVDVVLYCEAVVVV